MGKELKCAIIGLDTSHTIAFTQRMQAPDCKPEHKVQGMKVINAMRFPSAYQSEPDQDKRQVQLEGWGVKVTRDFNEAVKGVDAIMMEVNDPALHLEYFQKVAKLGLPVFLDKPPADTVENAKKVIALAKENNMKVFSSSSLRFTPQVKQIVAEVPNPRVCMTFGPLGKAPAGSSIVWYGVHAVEMLEQVMGIGAAKVVATQDPIGITAVIEYKNNKRGIVQLNEKFAISVSNGNTVKSYMIDTGMIYSLMVIEVINFFNGGPAPVTLESSLEVQKILNAIDAAVQTGKPQEIAD